MTTTDVVVESAIFDPVSIRRTAFRYALRPRRACASRRARSTDWRALGADRTARLINRMGRRARSPSVPSTRTRPNHRRHVSRSGPRGSTACSARR